MNIRRYALTYIATAIGLVALNALVQFTLNYDLSNGGMVILPPMVAGMIEGQRYVRDNARKPESAEMWKFARIAGAFSLAFAMVATVLLGFVVPEISTLMAQRMGAGILMGAVILQAALSLFVTRFFLAMGANSRIDRKGKRG